MSTIFNNNSVGKLCSSVLLEMLKQNLLRFPKKIKGQCLLDLRIWEKTFSNWPIIAVYVRVRKDWLTTLISCGKLTGGLWQFFVISL